MCVLFGMIGWTEVGVLTALGVRDSEVSHLHLDLR